MSSFKIQNKITKHFPWSSPQNKWALCFYENQPKCSPHVPIHTMQHTTHRTSNTQDNLVTRNAKSDTSIVRRFRCLCLTPTPPLPERKRFSEPLLSRYSSYLLWPIKLANTELALLIVLSRRSHSSELIMVEADNDDGENTARVKCTTPVGVYVCIPSARVQLVGAAQILRNRDLLG